MLSCGGVSFCLGGAALYCLGRNSGRDADILRSVKRVNQLRDLDSFWFPLKIEARKPTHKESPKVRNRRLRRKLVGSAQKPRLSVFCSGRQLYAQLIDDTKKKTLFFTSTLQASIRGSPPCSTADAAKRVGEEITKACLEQRITQVTIDRNGFGRGERMEAFNISLYQHGFLP